MQTRSTTPKISKKISILGAALLSAFTSSANTFDGEPVKGNMFVFYLTGVLFFTIYFLYVKLLRPQKRMNPVTEFKQMPLRKKYYPYRRIIKKTA